jgi:protocatechuate 3,4-dioxygenase beta subunit
MLIQPSRRELMLCLGSLPAVLRAGKRLPETDATAEGPAYKPGAPLKDDFIEPGLDGTPLLLSGTVYSTAGEPLPEAVLDLWEVNMQGVYDYAGYTLRGKVKTDRNGLYRVRLLVPKAYRTSPTSNFYRTAHIHVKASAGGHAMVTTELYVQGEPRNYDDSGPRPSLLLALQPAREGKTASFDFVLRHV